MTTYALIPGTGGDPWEWHLLTREIEARRHEVLPAKLPAGDDRAGWSEYADAVVEAIGDRRDVVPRRPVARRLYRATCRRAGTGRSHRAAQPDDPTPRRDRNEWWADSGQHEAEHGYFASVGLPHETADDEVALYFHDVASDVVEEAASHIPKQTMTPMAQAWPLESWPDVPTRALIGRDDRRFPAEFQLRVAKDRLGLDGDVIEGGHMVALGNPGEVADRLETFRRETVSPNG